MPQTPMRGCAIPARVSASQVLIGRIATYRRELTPVLSLPLSRVSSPALARRAAAISTAKLPRSVEVDLFVKHLHPAVGTELANGMLSGCASHLRRLATGICIEGDRVGGKIKGSGDFAKDNNCVQP
jgi:hypothetical protein